MAIIKCKMCGGDLEVTAGTTVAECEYCGTKQTLPKADEAVLQNLFNRANNLRIKSEFDKAEQIYEKILQENDGEAEAHWGIVLCKYGIEYVEDPKTFKRIPTCHRTSYDAVTADPDYLAAIEHADAAQRSIYEAEARAIDEIQKNILSIVKDEKPFDVFICYKETDENGKRTVDSAIANDIYYQLTQEGLKVFYAAITLEDKLGQAYEPYIFAALNSAKVMLVIGTQTQYFTAVWVKNEWSRYLKLMKSDRSKLLIPCYRDMDAYDLPEEFAHLQAQDMGKIGFINDVVRGIRKLTVTEAPKAAPAPEQAAAPSASTAPLLERAQLFLEDKDWSRADELAEQVLNLEPKNAQAYLIKLLAEQRVQKAEDLRSCAAPFDGSNHYQKALRFGDAQLQQTLTGYVTCIKERNENARLEGIYQKAQAAMSKGTVDDYLAAAKLFASIPQYRDAAQLAKRCESDAEETRQKNIYKNATSLMSRKIETGYLEAAKLFASISGYRDAAALEKECSAAAAKLQEAAEASRKDAILEKARKLVARDFSYTLRDAVKLLKTIPGWKDADQLARSCEARILELEKEAQLALAAKKRKTILITSIVAAVLALVIVVSLLANHVFIPNKKYNDAIALMDARLYYEAIEIFQALEGHRDSADQIIACKYGQAQDLMDAGKTAQAAMLFGEIQSIPEAKQKSLALWKTIAIRETVSCSDSHTVGLKADGTVVATGWNEYGQCNVSDWKDIVAVSCGDHHTVGLKADGTVVATGSIGYGQCDVGDWKNVVTISCGNWHTIGLKADGTVVATGLNNDDQCKVSSWRRIVAVSCGTGYTVGLKADGTVVATGDNEYDQCDISGWKGWKDIVAVSCGSRHTVGLKADGTVVATGWNEYGQCDISDWKDIVAVSCGSSHTVGLKADGTVVATGYNDDGRCDVSDWKDIVAISCVYSHTVGLKADGTVVATGDNDDGQCNVSDWTDIVAISCDSSHTVGLKADGTVVATGYNKDGECDVSDWTNIKLPDPKKP